ncbi:MAG: GDSL-type esterase/lipase family protein [Leptolyngbyaceae cyanobacterium MO_188.B28]|nr:GDSL-type esterase/lipase family protein [Leptolyngbyaceae cyanobacterium MO_188.B28]
MTDLGLIVLQLLADSLLPAKQSPKPLAVQRADVYGGEREALELKQADWITVSSPVARQRPAFSRSASIQPGRQSQRNVGPLGIRVDDQKPEFSQALSRPVSGNSQKVSKANSARLNPQLNRTPANSRHTSVQPLVSRLQLSSRSSSLLEAFSRFTGPRPSSGSQLYQQRLAALTAGKLYTRLSPDSFYESWVNAAQQPTYEQWRTLLTQEAKAMEHGQGGNRLTVVVGDSLSLWLPSEWLSTDRFWLNQGISGDTTAGILRRLSAFAQTRPDTIHVMAGINDLKNGASNAEVVSNLRQIMEQLHQTHPQAKIIVYSILPTRVANIPSDRIRGLNQQIAQTAQQVGIDYFDLQPNFADSDGDLRPELTTDGIHLTPQGYRVWQLALLSA